MKVYEKKILITKDFIDENAHVSNVMYVKWMNDVSIEHALKAGDTMEYQKQNSYMWVSKSHHIDYMYSAYEGDEVHIKTWTEPYKKTASIRRYEFTNQKGVLLCKAQTIFVCLNISTLRPIKIPEETSRFYL